MSQSGTWGGSGTGRAGNGGFKLAKVKVMGLLTPRYRWIRISLRILSKAPEERSNIERGKCGNICSLGLQSPALLSRVTYIDFVFKDNDPGKHDRSKNKYTF